MPPFSASATFFPIGHPLVPASRAGMPAARLGRESSIGMHMPNCFSYRSICFLFALCVLCDLPVRADERSPDVTQPPEYSQFIVVPLRVHVLTADDLPEIDCKLTDADVVRIIGKANGI